jgi:hypothetical protein
VSKLLSNFFEWYERHYRIHVALAAGLFTLQLIHLYWLSSQVVAERLTGHGYLGLDGVLQIVVVLVDYTEVPALVSVSLLYINELRKAVSWKSIAFLVFLNSQWLHIFWITDEFVVNATEGEATTLPAWLAWVAIGIDYLELPVIADTIRKLVLAVRDRALTREDAT